MVHQTIVVVGAAVAAILALAYAMGGEDEEAKNEPAAAIINVSSSFDLKTLFQTAGQKLVVLDFTAVRNAQHDNNACIDRPTPHRRHRRHVSHRSGAHPLVQ